jgi:hypothetical protein
MATPGGSKDHTETSCKSHTVTGGSLPHPPRKKSGGVGGAFPHRVPDSLPPVVKTPAQSAEASSLDEVPHQRSPSRSLTDQLHDPRDRCSCTDGHAHGGRDADQQQSQDRSGVAGVTRVAQVTTPADAGMALTQGVSDPPQLRRQDAGRKALRDRVAPPALGVVDVPKP